MADYPDFTIAALLKGLYLGVPKPLELDDAGNITAMLKALNVATPISVQADAGGNIQISLVAQELSEIINRFKYGAPDRDTFLVEVANAETKSIFTLAGKGQIYTAHVAVIEGETHKDDLIWMYLDGELISLMSFTALMDYNMTDYTTHPVVLRVLDDTNFHYLATLCAGYTFESSIEIKYQNISGPGAMNVFGAVIYSVIS